MVKRPVLRALIHKYDPLAMGDVWRQKNPHDLSAVAWSNLHGPDKMDTITSAGLSSERVALGRVNQKPISAPAILEDLVQHAERAGASDIHLQADVGEDDRGQFAFC